MMDEEMEDMVGEVFMAHEVDLDYEFDAVRFFDFSRDESPAEARDAELWFEYAESYPPSPFIRTLVLPDDFFVENVNTSQKLNDVENTTLLYSDPNIGPRPEFSLLDMTNRDCKGMDGGVFTSSQSGNLQKIQNPRVQLTTGLTFYNHMAKDPKVKTRSVVKPSFPRSSTLMKPTASQLAKQNRFCRIGGSRSQMPLVKNDEKSSICSSSVEIQSSKRQKLEGGHLHKVADTKQQTNLVHKAPKKDGTLDGNLMHTKLKLTIPREPDLVTSHRAQRIRPKNPSELKDVTFVTHGFKARPLNRKILDAPSLPLPQKSTPQLPEFQEFHLKTMERAVQHTSAVSSYSLYCNDSDKGMQKPSTSSLAENGTKRPKRPNPMDAPKQDGCETLHSFKARPLNKKIFSSKGDLGLFRNSKREATVPMEFHFGSTKKVQHNPPVDELFSKLSLRSELQQHNGTHMKLAQPTCIPTKGLKENRLAQPTCIPTKGLKENRLAFPQKEQEVTTHLPKGKSLKFQVEQIHSGSNGGIHERCPQSSKNRSLSIR